MNSTWTRWLVVVLLVAMTGCGTELPRCSTVLPDGGPSGLTVDCLPADAGTGDAGVCDGGVC